jgi:hypothetical protein
LAWFGWTLFVSTAVNNASSGILPEGGKKLSAA